jgi:hypothetical protein
MNTSNLPGEMEDIKINVKLKISALWIAMLFVFAYVDIFAFYKPGIIEGIMAGKVAIFQVNQMFLFFTNIAVGTLYAVSILGSCIGETWAFYIFGSILEILLLLSIVRYAWKWPKYKKERFI